MPSLVDLYNISLSHCGTRSKIDAVDEGSPEANALTTHYATSRDSLLRTYDWNFSRMTVSLGALTSTPPARWLYKYALPADYLRLRRLNDTPEPWPETLFEMAGDKDGTGAVISVILTNVSPVSAIYTARVEDPNRWDAGFFDALGFMLASRTCYELTGKDNRVGALLQEADRAIRGAAAAMANEGSGSARLRLPDALLARGYSDGSELFGTPQAWDGWVWERPSN